MKKVIITSVCALFLNINCLKAQQNSNDCNKKNVAIVEQVQGIYIFTDSKPVKEYDFLGSVEGPKRSMGCWQYERVRDNLIKEALKEYPKTDALILHPHDGAVDKADAIKFKE